MHVLIVIGAGASFDCWPTHIKKTDDVYNYVLPLAKDLFSPYHHQGDLLKELKILDIASALRSKANALGNKFDIEAELLSISERAIRLQDNNMQQSLFKTRFYIQRLITLLTNNTVDRTQGHTIYIDLIRKLKIWTEDDPQNRVVDIVTFNYDTLLEMAMENNYSIDWKFKNDEDQMTAYYRGKNVRIYKPHGSINWGRNVSLGNSDFQYTSLRKVFYEYNRLTLHHSFQFINPDSFGQSGTTKEFIPAIAIPFKEKSNFDESPLFMQNAMYGAIDEADHIITLGWKGAEKHFTSLLLSNVERIKSVHVISPNADTQLTHIFPQEKIKLIANGFKDFIENDNAFEKLLSGLQ